MLIELIKAMLGAGVLTGLASFVLFCWSLRAEDQHEAGDGADSGDKQSDRQPHWSQIEKVQQSGLYRAQSSLLHKHWVEYGGGFYGLIAVLTLLWIEGKDIIEFITDHGSLTQLLNSGIVSSLVNLMIEAVMNAIVAFFWPGYWLAELTFRGFVLWVVAAWLGYLIGKRLAEWQCDRSAPSD